MSGQHRRRTPDLRRRLLGTVAVLAAAVGIATGVSVPGVYGAYSARITNSTDTVASTPYFTCRGAETDAGVSTAYLSYPMSDANVLGLGVFPAADVSGNGRTGNYTLTGVTFNQSSPVCPRDTAYPNSVTLNGSSGYLYGPNTATAGPSNFTEEIWFKTTTGGGKLIGFGSSRTGSSGSYDRHIYLTNAGNLVFGVYPGTVRTVQSGATYLDNKWHYAAATLSSTAGMTLYVDGVAVAADPNTTTAQTDYNGYWRMGYDNLTSWTNQPSNFFYTGSLAWGSVHTTKALTAAQILAHYNAGR